MNVTLRSKPLKNGSKSLYLDVYEDGKRTYEYLHLYLIPEVDAHAKRQNINAMAKANKMRNEYVLGKHKIEAKDKSTVTLMEWYDEYYRRMKEERNVSKAVFDHLDLLKLILVDYLKKNRKQNIKLADFGRKHVLGFIQNMREWEGPKKGRLSQCTMNTYQQRFKAVFNEAIREGYITCNPFNLLDITEKIAKAEPHKEGLTMDEIIIFSKVTPRYPSYGRIQQAFLFGCFTGLRLSDIIDLKWSDIKNFGKNGTIVKEQIKTGNIVSVPICDMATRYLPEKGASDNIFDMPPLTTMRRGLAWLVDASGIKKNVTFHTSRHTFASLMFAANNDLKTVSGLLGHTSVETTTIYTDVFIKEKKTAMDKISAIFK